MSKNVKYTLTTLFIVLTRSFDAYCTNQLTPDLSKEANPLVSVLGFGWTPLLLVISALTAYVIYCYYIATFKPMNLLPTEKGFSFSNTIAYSFLGKKEQWFAIFYKLPKDIKRFNNYIGHTMPACLVFAGIVSTLMWLLIKYTAFYAPYHSAPVIYAILVAGCSLIVYRFHAALYRQYLQNTV